MKSVTGAILILAAVIAADGPLMGGIAPAILTLAGLAYFIADWRQGLRRMEPAAEAAQGAAGRE